MSLILDALRGGRARATPSPGSNPAQTDAVLQTLGYGRFKSASPADKVKRLVSVVVLGVIMAIAIWASVVWITRRVLATRTPAESSRFNTRASLTTAPAPRGARPPATTPPASAAVPQTASPPVHAVPSVEPGPAAAPPVGRGAAAAVVPTPSVTAARPPAGGLHTEAALPASGPAPAVTPVVQNSRRPDVPATVPPSPTGAPSSRSSLSMSAGSNAGVAVSESDHFQLALYYQRIGDFENSLVHYRAVLQRDELNAKAHNNLGLLYRDKGLLDDAVKEFGRAIAIDPRYVKAHNNLGVAYLSQTRNDAAAAEFRTALSIDPANVESMVNLAIAQKEVGQRVDARATLARALEIDPRSAEAHYNLGLIADDMGDKPQALAHYRAFLQYVTDHPDLVPQVRARIDALSR